MKIKFVFLFILIIFLSLSCSKKNNEKYNPLFFNVDSLLIGEQYTDSSYQFVFFSPKDWNSVPDDMFENIRKNIYLNPDSSFIKIVPEKIFMNNKIAAFCLISKFENVNLIKSNQNEFEKIGIQLKFIFSKDMDII